MNVSEAVASRLTVRSFLDRPVDGELLRGIMEKASRAASGGNLQPWNLHILGGEHLKEFKIIMQKRLKLSGPDVPEYTIYPPGLSEPYRTRRFQLGEEMYEKIGIAREDKAARAKWFEHNYQFFGAPVAVFCYIDRCMNLPQWSDMGMYLATLALLLREEGLDCCFQEAWALYHKTVDAFVKPDAKHMLFCGVGVGYRDPSAAVNSLKSKRAVLDEFATFSGI